MASLYATLEAAYREQYNQDEANQRDTVVLFPEAPNVFEEAALYAVLAAEGELSKKAGVRNPRATCEFFSDIGVMREWSSKGELGADAWLELANWFRETRALAIKNQNTPNVMLTWTTLAKSKMELLKQEIRQVWKARNPKIPCSWTSDDFTVGVIFSIPE